MKVPVGATVIIDLWNSPRGNGMVKYETDTMSLLRGESDFHLEKGDKAIVIKSDDNFVQIIPKDSFSSILKFVNGKIELDIDGLARKVRSMLLETVPETGGILPYTDMFDAFEYSSVKGLVKAEHLHKAAKSREKLFEEISFEGETFLGIKISEIPDELTEVIDVFKRKGGNASDIELKHSLGWSDVRAHRAIEHLLANGTLRAFSSYKDGNRYCLLGDA